MRFSDQAVSILNKPRCSLGEGLYVESSNRFYWVDILASELHLSESNSPCFLDEEPTAVIAHEDRMLVVVATTGLLFFDGHKELVSKVYAWTGLVHNSADYRTNDAVFFRDGTGGLVGFMHRRTPGECSGYVYRFDRRGRCRLLYSGVHIPNGFVLLKCGGVLIADSHLQVIKKMSGSHPSSFVDAPTWHRCERGAPDGGCLVDEQVIFAIWGEGILQVFDLQGIAVSKIHLPVKFPSNVKPLDHNSLIVTSARPEEVTDLDSDDGSILRVNYEQ